MPRAWDVEYTDEFREWWTILDARGQEAVGSKIDRLAEQGPALGFPDSSQVKSSRHGRMRELRVQSYDDHLITLRNEGLT